MIGPDVYKERHGHPFHRRRFHDCKMPGCKTKLDWDRSKLMTHFFRRHKNITMRSYYEGYVQRVSNDTFLNLLIPNKATIFMVVRRCSQDHFSCMTIDHLSNTIANIRITGIIRHQYSYFIKTRIFS